MAEQTLTNPMITLAIMRALRSGQVRVKAGDPTNCNFNFTDYGVNVECEIIKYRTRYAITRGFYQAYDPDDIEFIGGFSMSEQPNGHNNSSSDNYNYRNLIDRAFKRYNNNLEKGLLKLISHLDDKSAPVRCYHQKRSF